MTSLPAVDGTLFALGATGGLGAPAVATMTGLTIIAGASAWVAAREEFGRFERREDRWTLVVIAFASTLLAAIAASAGAFVGARVDLAVLPTAAGVALLTIASEMMGARVPRVHGIPLATLLIAAGAVTEVTLWTL